MKICVDFWLYTQDWIKYTGDNYFANISVKFRVFLTNMYCLFSLTGNLRLFLIYDFELINTGKWMAFGVTMLVCGIIGP